MPNHCKRLAASTTFLTVRVEACLEILNPLKIGTFPWLVMLFSLSLSFSWF